MLVCVQRVLIADTVLRFFYIFIYGLCACIKDSLQPPVILLYICSLRKVTV